MSKLYAERDIENLETYDEHIDALRSGVIFSNSDIAAELAYRDSIIDALRRKLAEKSIQQRILTDKLTREAREFFESALEGISK